MTSVLMSAIELAAIFFIYSLLGWVIEVIYRSALAKKFIFPGLFKYLGKPIPLLPIYGFGALLLLLLSSSIYALPLILRLLIYIIFLTLLELAGSVFVIRFFGVRLWDYSSMPFNYRGHVSALHSSYWLIGAFLFERIHPYIYQIVSAPWAP